MKRVLHSGDPIVVRTRASQYNHCPGVVVEPDEEGGFEVQLPGVPLLHFESSELRRPRWLRGGAR